MSAKTITIDEFKAASEKVFPGCRAELHGRLFSVDGVRLWRLTSGDIRALRTELGVEFDWELYPGEYEGNENVLYIQLTEEHT